jgi:hypothetical protein
MALELVKWRCNDFEINTANTEIVAHEVLLKIKLAILSGTGNAKASLQKPYLLETLNRVEGTE